MSEITARLFETYKQHPKTAILMSGQGTNTQAILENQEIRDLYDIQLIATDSPNSKAGPIADEHGLELVSRPAGRFTSIDEREDYFRSLASDLLARRIKAVFYGGFMKIVTANFCQQFPGLNMHPADLTILGDDGLPKYRGMKSLAEMRADLGHVRSTLHVVEELVDSGSAVSLTERIYPDPSWSDKQAHDYLKPSEHRLFVQTLILLGRGVLTAEALPYEKVEIQKKIQDLR